MATDVDQTAVILGAGAWGTALAWHLANEGRSVCLWGRERDDICRMQRERVNPNCLPDCHLGPSLLCEPELEKALAFSSNWIIAVPSSAFSDFLKLIKPYATDAQRIAWVTKGLDPITHRPLHESALAIFPDHPLAVLSGPSLAAEVSQAKPTAVVVAGTDEQFNEDLQALFHSPSFRVYKNDDLCGVELCAALKNVLAIAAGLSDGLGLGSNARAALLTRGLVEMRRLCEALGGQASTLSGLAGLGDLLLTSTDDRSRNRRFGLALGRGLSVQDALQEIGQVVEGQTNCAHAHALAQELGVDAPITEQVYRVVYEGLSPKQAAKILLERDAGHE